MPSWWDWNAVAAIGQCLGAAATFAAVWVALRSEWRQHLPRLTVWVGRGITMAAPDWSGKHRLIVHVINTGIRPVSMTNGFAETKSGRVVFAFTFERNGEGQIVEPGRHISLDIPHEHIKKSILEEKLAGTVSMRLRVSDETGKQHRCKFELITTDYTVDQKPATTHAPGSVASVKQLHTRG